MPESFDAYHKWLGIPPQEQPPHHYRLIGVSLFESDPDVIDVACDQRMAFLHQCAAGPHSRHSQRLLNEISAARVCLLDAERKADYDEALRARRERDGAAEPSFAKLDGSAVGQSELGVQGLDAASPSETAELGGPAPWGAAVRRVNRTWLFWLSVHAVLFYLGWTYLLKPRLSPSRDAAPSVAVRPNPARAVERTPRAERSKPAQPEQANTSAVVPPATSTDEAEARAGGKKEQRAPSAAERVTPELIRQGPDDDATGAAAARPTRELPPEVELPPVEDAAPVTLGTVTELGERNVELVLESEAAELEDGGQIHLERGAGAARWIACRVEGADEREHVALGDFLVQDGSLRFQWREGAGAAAGQLRNCRVHLSTGPDRFTMALREAALGAPLALDLSEKFSRLLLEIPNRPKQDSLLLEVTGLDGFPGEPSFEDGQRVAQLGRKDLTVSVDDQFGVELQIAFDRYGRDDVALKVSASFKLDGQQTELTTERLGNLRRQIEELPSSRGELSGLQTRASNLRGELARLSAQRPTNLVQRAALTARTAELRGALSRTDNAARSLARRVGQLEQFQEELPELERLAQALDGSATIRYRVFAKTGEGELDLVRSGAQPAGALGAR